MPIFVKSLLQYATLIRTTYQSYGLINNTAFVRLVIKTFRYPIGVLLLKVN